MGDDNTNEGVPPDFVAFKREKKFFFKPHAIS